jgi:hypothetical protein
MFQLAQDRQLWLHDQSGRRQLFIPRPCQSVGNSSRQILCQSVGANKNHSRGLLSRRCNSQFQVVIFLCGIYSRDLCCLLAEPPVAHNKNRFWVDRQSRFWNPHKNRFWVAPGYRFRATHKNRLRVGFRPKWVAGRFMRVNRSGRGGGLKKGKPVTGPHFLFPKPPKACLALPAWL